MPIEIIRDDITRVHADAIVNAANETLLGGGGVDGAIHRAAGPELLEECRGLNGCRTGFAKITKGYRLPAKYVIHTVGPIWHGGAYGEEQKLVSCYQTSLALAKEHGCESVAFPLISAGAYGYPRAQALKVAMDTIRDFLMENDMLVYIVVFDKGSFSIGDKLYAGIKRYIDDHYVDEFGDSDAERSRRLLYAQSKAMDVCAAPKLCDAMPEPGAAPEPPELILSSCAAPESPDALFIEKGVSLEEMLKKLDESFTQMVLRKIDEKGMKDSDCYKRANIDRKLFSKIRSDIHYKPGKRTAVALAIALELDLNETQDLLRKAGFTLSNSSKFDVIIEFCILNGYYDIHDVNRYLFKFDQQLLGA